MMYWVPHSGQSAFCFFILFPFKCPLFFLFFTSLLLLFSHQKFKSDFYSLQIQEALSHSQHHALTSDGKGERDDTTFSFPFLSFPFFFFCLHPGNQPI
jgi:FPC/CPF motif-containing protein YcgG